MVHLGRHGNGKSRDVKRNSVKGRLGFSGEVAQAWGRARVSWAGLFMSVDVLGILGEVNPTPKSTPSGGILGKVVHVCGRPGYLGQGKPSPTSTSNLKQNSIQRGQRNLNGFVQYWSAPLQQRLPIISIEHQRC